MQTINRPRSTTWWGSLSPSGRIGVAVCGLLGTAVLATLVFGFPGDGSERSPLHTFVITLDSGSDELQRNCRLYGLPNRSSSNWFEDPSGDSAECDGIEGANTPVNTDADVHTGGDRFRHPAVGE